MINYALLTMSEIAKGIEIVLNKYPKFKNVKKVVLFGSYATGKATPQSDLNLCLYDVDKENRLDILDFLEFELRLDEYFKPKVHLLSLIAAHETNRPLYDLVLKTSIEVYSKGN